MLPESFEIVIAGISCNDSVVPVMFDDMSRGTTLPMYKAHALLRRVSRGKRQARLSCTDNVCQFLHQPVYDKAGIPAL